MGILHWLFGKRRSASPQKARTPNGASPFMQGDNVGTFYDTHVEVKNLWASWMASGVDNEWPFVVFSFANRDSAQNAMLDLLPFKLAADSDKLISTEPIDFGIYPRDRRRRQHQPLENPRRRQFGFKRTV